MKWFTRIVPFAFTFLLGASVASFLAPPEFKMVAATPIAIPSEIAVEVPVSVEGLIGTWRGTWGYDRSFCTIEINSVKGEKFYGTLKKDGFAIAIVGTLDPETRTVSFEETRVLRLNAEMGEWSLGKNRGSFSPDAHTLSGTGTDKWGTYGWDASKY